MAAPCVRVGPGNSKEGSRAYQRQYDKDRSGPPASSAGTPGPGAAIATATAAAAAFTVVTTATAATPIGAAAPTSTSTAAAAAVAFAAATQAPVADPPLVRSLARATLLHLFQVDQVAINDC